MVVVAVLDQLLLTLHLQEAGEQSLPSVHHYLFIFHNFFIQTNNSYYPPPRHMSGTVLLLESSIYTYLILIFPCLSAAPNSINYSFFPLDLIRYHLLGQLEYYPGPLSPLRAFQQDQTIYSRYMSGQRSFQVLSEFMVG